MKDFLLNINCNETNCSFYDEKMELNCFYSISNKECIKSEKMKCIPGCKHFDGGELLHHKDCPFYPNSLSKKYNDLVNKNHDIIYLLKFGNILREDLLPDDYKKIWEIVDKR